MRSRCYFESDRNYKRYGAKGIAICDEWRGDYLAFERWALANGYQNGLSIDRKKSHFNYSPETCEWVTRTENSRRKLKRKLAPDGKDPRSFSPEEVVSIRTAAHEGEARLSIARRLGVPREVISGIVRGSTYAEIGGPRTAGRVGDVTRSQVKSAIRRFALGQTLTEIGEALGISGPLVGAIVHRRGKMPGYIKRMIAEIEATDDFKSMMDSGNCITPAKRRALMKLTETPDAWMNRRHIDSHGSGAPPASIETMLVLARDGFVEWENDDVLWAVCTKRCRCGCDRWRITALGIELVDRLGFLSSLQAAASK